MNEVIYGFVNEDNILIQTARFIENDFETIERVKNEYGASAYYKMNLDKEPVLLGITYWNGSRFLWPSEFPSWVFNEEINNWVAPIQYPEDGKVYVWNEENLNWEEIQVSE